MTKYRDFGSGTGKIGDEPVTFKLYDEDFECRKAVQGKVLLDLVVKAQSENAADAAQTISEFFKMVLLDESYGRFNALITHPEKIVTVETLGEISGWLVEVYAGRPEQAPEVSSPGQ